MSGKERNVSPGTSVAFIVGIIAVVGLLVGGSVEIVTSVAHAAGLPSNLFVANPPANAMGVSQARRTAQPGKPIVVHGVIGGVAKPIADQYAMFLIADASLPICKNTCSAFCEIPRAQLLASMATVQVADRSGRPLKVSLLGANGLQPLTKVVVSGTVATLNQQVMVINAQHIFVSKGQNSAPVKPTTPKQQLQGKRMW